MKARPLILASAILASAAVTAEPAAPSPVKVACVGDSITAGSGLPEGRSYPDQLQEMLGDTWKVANFGVSGRTLLKKGDFPYWKEKAYQDALKSEPDVVIIMLGTNDTKPQNFQHEKDFAGDCEELVKAFQALASRPKVLLCRPCPVPGEGNFGINDRNLRVYLGRIDALAEAMKLERIDMHAALVNRPQLLPDRVHPNEEGAGEMAKAAYQALTGRVFRSVPEKEGTPVPSSPTEKARAGQGGR